MPGRIVNATNLDSVRIEILGEGRAVTIPASLILAADSVLKYVLASDGHLNIDMVEDDDTGEQGWEARTEHPDLDTDPMDVLATRICSTPWETILKLAEVLERGGRK